MRNIVVLAFIAFSFMGALYSRFIGILFYWWYGLFRPDEWIWIDISSLRISLLAALVVIIPCLLTGIFPKITHSIHFALVSWVLLGVIVELFGLAGCGDKGWYWIDWMARVVLMLLLTDAILKTRRHYFFLVAVVAASVGFFTAKAGLVSLIEGGNTYGQQGLGGSYSKSNGFALASGLVVFLFIATAQNLTNPAVFPKKATSPLQLLSFKLARYGCLIAVPLTIFNIVSLFSRGNALGIVGGLFVWFLLQKKKLRLVFVWFTLISLAILLVPIPEGYEERIETVTSDEWKQDSSAAARPHFWRVAIDMASDNLLGVGIGCYPIYYRHYDTSDGEFGLYPSVHSSHFQLLSELGYIGLFIWIFLFAKMFSMLRRIRRHAMQSTMPADMRHFFLSNANALIAMSVFFLIAGSFYELARNDITLLSFIWTVVLDRLFRSASQEIENDKAHS